MTKNKKQAASDATAEGMRLLRQAGPGRPGHESPPVDFALLEAYVADELARSRKRRPGAAGHKPGADKADQRIAPGDARRVRANIVQYANWSAFHARLYRAACERGGA